MISADSLSTAETSSNIFCRTMLCKRGLCRHTVYVRLSVCRVWGFPLKQINIPSIFFHYWVSHNILVFPCQTSYGNIPTEGPLTRASNADGVGKNRDSGQIAGHRSMTAAVRTISATVQCAVYRRQHHASVNIR